MKNKSTNRPIKDPIYTPIKVAINWKWHNRKAKKTKSEISYKRCNSNFYNGRKKLQKNFGKKNGNQTNNAQTKGEELQANNGENKQTQTHTLAHICTAPKYAESNSKNREISRKIPK